MRDVEEDEMKKELPPTAKKEWMSREKALEIFRGIPDLVAMLDGLSTGASKV